MLKNTAAVLFLILFNFQTLFLGYPHG